MDIIVRQAELKDANGIAKVHVRTWQCVYRGQISDEYLDKLSIEKRTKIWEENLKNPRSNTKTFVAELDGKIVGFASAGNSRDKDTDSTTGELYAIYVDGDAMGKGIGSSLHKKCIDHLKELGFTKAILWVLVSNDKTRRWYEKRGWKTDGKTKIDETDGVKLQETRYSRDL